MISLSPFFERQLSYQLQSVFEPPCFQAFSCIFFMSQRHRGGPSLHKQKRIFELAHPTLPIDLSCLAHHPSLLAFTNPRLKSQGLFFLYDALSNPHGNDCPSIKTRRRSSQLENNTQVLLTTEFLLTSSSFVGRSCVLRFEAQSYLYVCQL